MVKVIGHRSSGERINVLCPPIERFENSMSQHTGPLGLMCRSTSAGTCAKRKGGMFCAPLGDPDRRRSGNMVPRSAQVHKWSRFPIETTCFWLHPALRTHYTVERVAVELADANERLAASVPGHTESMAGFCSLVRAAYVADVCRGEATGTQTIAATEAALACSGDATRTGDQDQERACRKARNVADALDFVTTRDSDAFDTDFIVRLHEMVLCGFDEQWPGRYREQMARPAGQAWFLYLTPCLIGEKLDELCREISAWRVDTCIEAAKRASVFMARFLLIHPFRNGNGRVARLVVSWLMRQWSIVPLSIMYGENGRDTYLTCLEHAHLENDASPGSLALLILWCGMASTRNACYAMDL